MDPCLSTQSADRLSTSYYKGFTLLNVHIVFFARSYYLIYENILIVYTTVLMMPDKCLKLYIILCNNNTNRTIMTKQNIKVETLNIY